MLNEAAKTIAKQTYERYGSYKQQIKTIEELGELSSAISKLLLEVDETDGNFDGLEKRRSMVRYLL